MEDTPEPLTRYRSNIPEKLQDIITQLLDKNKELRYQSAEGVMADLKRLVYDSQQSTYSRAISAKPKRRELLIGLISISAVVVIAIAAFFYFSGDSNKEVNDAVPMIAVLPFQNLGSADDD